ncbi:fimbrial protein [Klebsiella sp. NPDC088457]
MTIYNNGGRVFAGVLLALLLQAFAPGAVAWTTSRHYIWNDSQSSSNGQSAGTCVYTYPDSLPFSVPRSIIADNSVPLGSIIGAWSYADFNVTFSISCSGSGIESETWKIAGTDAAVSIMDPSYALAGLGFNLAGANAGNGILKTSVEGVGIQFFIKSDTSLLGNNAADFPYIRLSGFDVCGGAIFAATGVEHEFCGPTSGQAGMVLRMLDTRTEGGVTRWFMPTSSLTFSLRAELIKTGPVTAYGPLSVSHLFNSWMAPAPANVNTNPPTHFLSGSGITLVRPTCKLSTQRSPHYSLNMGEWSANTIAQSGEPAFGLKIPLQLDLECVGMAENVRMRFEDAGASPLATHNISLYDAAAGNKIDGLEIELLYGDAHVDINGPAINLGNHGSTVLVTGAGSDKVYTLTSTSYSRATLQARYIQRAAITRSNIPYTGPVTGTVNLFMVYD